MVVKHTSHPGKLFPLQCFITGSLVGAYYGYNAIPSRWIYDLNNDVKKQLDQYAEFFTEVYKG